MSRLVVHEAVYDKIVESVAEMSRQITIGAGIEFKEIGPTMGPVISAKQRDRVEKMCQHAAHQGARMVVGGRNFEGAGFFHAPTVFDSVTPEMNIAQEEVFGPVLAVLKFKSDDEAVQIANGTDYGLVAGVFTRDIQRALKTAAKLHAGQVFINEWYAGGVETPFGGVKKSGYGREKGREALFNYVQTKNIAISL